MSIQLSTGVLHVKDNGEYDTIDVLRAPYKAVDNQLSSTSENPVQNKVVKQALDGKVDDVQINGTSIISNGVAEIPKANNAVLGAVKANTAGNYDGGVAINEEGLLYTSRATDAQVKNGVQVYKPIVPNNQHYSTFYGLTKAAGVDMASSDNPVGEYTEEAKKAIRKMLGIPNTQVEFIANYTVSSDVASITVNTDILGQPFKLTKAKIIVFLKNSTIDAATYYLAKLQIVRSDEVSDIYGLPTLRQTDKSKACFVYDFEIIGDKFITSNAYQNTTGYGQSLSAGISYIENKSPKYITGFTISQYTQGSLVPSGTQILIYGVRYD